LSNFEIYLHVHNSCSREFPGFANVVLTELYANDRDRAPGHQK
jgi:hypothetical protein